MGRSGVCGVLDLMPSTNYIGVQVLRDESISTYLAPLGCHSQIPSKFLLNTRWSGSRGAGGKCAEYSRAKTTPWTSGEYLHAHSNSGVLLCCFTHRHRLIRRQWHRRWRSRLSSVHERLERQGTS